MSISVNGFYSAYLSGTESNGFALLVFKDGRIAGADATGVIFTGSYDEDNNGARILGFIDVSAPPDGTLIQGISTGNKGVTYKIKIDIPYNFCDLQFIRLDTIFGPINVKLKKIRSYD